MAKSNSFFGLRRGSTKTLTFSVLDGMQITKDRVAQVKNPRTDMQMQQRCLMKLCSVGYSAMKSIVDHSFEGVSYGMKSMSRFASLNYPLVKAASKAFNPTFGFPSFGDSSTRMGQFVVSQGSLNRPVIENTTVSFDTNKIVVKLPSAKSVAGLANALGINLGELYTMTALVQDDNKNVAFVWLRFSFPEADGVMSDTAIKVESNLASSAAVAGNVLTIELLPQEQRISNQSAMLYDFIRSAKGSSSWLRSSAKLSNAVGDVDYSLGWIEAIATYPTGNSYILNDGGNGIESNSTTQFGVNVEVINSAGSVPSADKYTIEGTGLYFKGDRCVITVKQKNGQAFSQGTFKVNNSVVQQNPVGTITFEVTGVTKVTFDINEELGGNIGE